MSALPNDCSDPTDHGHSETREDAPAQRHGERGPARGEQGSGEPLLAGSPVVVRRHAGVAALIGAAASAVAIAYLWRASQTMTVLDWTLFGVMSVIAVAHLVALVDARTPLLVADDLGVRIRLGHEWRGLPWEAVGRVVVHPRRGPLRDGRLVLVPQSLARALDGLDAKARRHIALNQKMYGAALAVPLGTTIRVSSGEGSVTDRIAGLALGRADVLELDPRTLEVVESDQASSASAAPAQGARDEAATAQGARDEGAPAPATPGQARAPQPASAQGAGADRAPSTSAADRASTADRTTPRAEADSDVPRAVAREVFPRMHDDTPRSGGAATASSEGSAIDAPVEQVSATAASTATGTAAPAPTTSASPGPEEPASRPIRRSMLGGIGTIVSRVAKGRSHDVDAGAPDAGEPLGGSVPGTASVGPAGTSIPVPLRETRPGLRAEATLPSTSGNNALDTAPAADGRELHRPGSVDLVFERVDLDERVRPISTLGDPVAPLVIDDYVTEPAYDPVIGPELTAARTRLGLSVDDLAERTRIRPHVIESIEVDDFAPCGGDFYARGHLRTLARILGKDPEPLLQKFEERYATAPINARRVFEAELATGMTGSMRSTVGGPNWGLLIGVVLSLVLVWGVVRLFTTEPVEMVEMPAPVLNGSAGVDSGYPAEPPAAAAVVEPLTVRLTAAQGDSDVVVRDGDGMVVYSGEMVLGERKTLRLAPPVRVRAEDGGMIEVRVGGRDLGLLGAAGDPARRTLR